MVYNVSISTFLYIYVRCIVLYKISLLEKLCVWCVYAPYSLFTFQHQIYFYKLVQLLCFAICMYNLVLVMLHVQYNIAYYIYNFMNNVYFASTCSSSFLKVFIHVRGVLKENRLDILYTTCTHSMYDIYLYFSTFSISMLCQ